MTLPNWDPLTTADQLRQLLGKPLDAAGLGPRETPFECVYSEAGMTLRRYTTQRASKTRYCSSYRPLSKLFTFGMPRLRSVWCKGALRVIAGSIWLNGARPDSSGPNLGLDDYADRLLVKCLDVIRAETREQSVFLTGHSLGGTFAVICAALHRRRVAGLILLGTPLHFGPHVGPLNRLVAASPDAHVITTLMNTVPGSLLTVFSSLAVPESFIRFRWLDWLNSVPDAEALRTHLLVVRWTLDERPLTRRLFTEVVEYLYRRNCFMSGHLKIGGSRARPDHVSAPLLSVVDKPCNLVPPEAILPFHQVAPSVDKELLWYQGDAGVALQHVGPLVGRDAHQSLWPQIIRWMQTRY